MSPSDRTMLDRVDARLLRIHPEPFRARVAEAMGTSVSADHARVRIRLALGSTRAAIVRLLVGRVVALAVAGVAIGALLGLWLSRFIATMLFHVTARDPVTLAASAAVLLVTATVAAWLPGRRAASADPAGIIRNE